MLSIEGKVFNLDGRTVTVGDEQRFVLNFTVSQYLGKKNDKPAYRSVAVAVWDKRGESLEKLLTEQSIVALKTNHYRAEGFNGRDGIDAKIKTELRAGDHLDILYKNDRESKGTEVTDDDYIEETIGQEDDPFDRQF